MASQKSFLKKNLSQPIIVVSGLPRSGTSMMMQMLEAGGIEIFSDHWREADEDNPKGYYEFERVQELDKQANKSWIGEVRGKAVKVVSQLLRELPQTYFYKLIFMNRELGEVVASQKKMLGRRGNADNESNDEKLRYLFEKHLHEIKYWLGQQAGFEVIEVEYGKVLNDSTGQSVRLRTFLETNLNLEKMAGVVDEKFYRNRSL